MPRYEYDGVDSCRDIASRISEIYRLITRIHITMDTKLTFMSCAWCLFSQRCPNRQGLCKNYKFDDNKFCHSDCIKQHTIGHATKHITEIQYASIIHYILHNMAPYYLTTDDMYTWIIYSKLTFECFCQIMLARNYATHNIEIYKRRHLKDFWERMEKLDVKQLREHI